jgi:ADP-L-glycero-D-manno-heptose 6-epimerase
MPDVLQDRYQYFTCADIEKLRAFGYERQITPLPDAVRDYVVNYLIPGRHLGDEPGTKPQKVPEGSSRKSG